MRGLNAILATVGVVVLLSSVSAWAGDDTSVANVSRPIPDGTINDCWTYYPPSMQAKAQGAVQVAFVVETDGSISDLHIAQSSGSRLLDWAAIACAQHWHYTPAKRGGIPERVEWSSTVHFDPLTVYARDDFIDTSQPSSDGSPHVCLNYYPVEAMRENVQGMTTVAFVIDIDGSVRDEKVLRSSGSPLLDDATIACVRHWHYIPARRDGHAVAVPWQSSVDYASSDRRRSVRQPQTER